jgi:hypothetical protein
MVPSSIERRVAAPGGPGILTALVLLAGCGDDSSTRALPDASSGDPADASSGDPADASPGDLVDASPGDLVDASPDQGPDAESGPAFVVRGTAAGLLGAVDLELRGGDELERLTVARDGELAFAARLREGEAYTVVLVDPDAPCTLGNASGVIAGADPVIELTCTGPSLAGVAVSGIAPAIELVPDTTDYVVDLPLLQSAVTVTAIVATAGDTLAVAGTPVASGAPSPELPLGLGDNEIDIVVENSLGWQRTYRLTLRRAAQVAQYAYAKASNTGTGDLFGASMALSGDTLAVGVPNEDSASQGVDGNQEDDSAANSGAVYVFRRDGAVWQQEAYLKASNTAPSDRFGTSVALDGDVLAVGAPDEDGTAVNSGAVYVFRRDGATWEQEAYLKASNAGASDRFGRSVALDGGTLAVGADGEASAAQGVDGDQANDSAVNSGAVYVFRHTGTAWLQEAYVKASNTGAQDGFGWRVALAGDTLAVAAYGEDSADTGVDGDQDDNAATNSGAVYVFRRTGATWEQEAYLKASNTGANDFFGISLALSGDTLAAGAYREDSAATGVDGDQDDESGSDSGAVYVFRRTGATWEQEAYLKASNTGNADELGWSVALSGDLLAVGAVREDSASPGVDGGQDDESAANSGAVYVFRRTGATWEQEAYLKASNPGTDDELGWSVALSGDTLAVAADREDSAATGVNGLQDDDSAANSGAVYVFH